MNGINLQIFALTLNTKTSIVDYLKSTGQDSSYTNRQKLAKQYGISNYTGTAEQNTKLLNMIKNASSASSTTSTSTKNTQSTKSTAAKNTGTKNTAETTVVEQAKGVLHSTPTYNAANTVEKAVLDTSTPVTKSNAVLDADYVATPTKLGDMPIGGAQSYVDAVKNGTLSLDHVPDEYLTDVLNILTGKTTQTSTAPTYTAPTLTTPTFTPVEAPTYTAPTTQAQQATSITERLDADTLNTLNSKFQTSQAYEQAMQYTNGLLQQLNTGKTSYTDQIAQLINDYQNREKFSYDSSTDPLFQQMLSSAMQSGNIAMQDTMGQAAALTGGYGSSYSQAVGNNAYNQYLQEAYNKLPDYYQLAMEAYNMEGNNLLNQISLLDTADSKEYDRLYNAYSTNYNQAQNLYNQEYGAWKDSVSNAYNYANMLNSDYWNTMDYNEGIRQYEQNFGYQQYQDALAQSNWQNQFNYQQYQDQLTQNNWQNQFAFDQYLSELDQYNKDRDFGWQQSEAEREQSNIDWEHSFSQSEADRDQGNIDWEHGYKESESEREQGNIDWEHNFAESESDREQGNIDWEHNFSESESQRDQSNIDWEHSFSESEANRNQSNWEKDYIEDQRQFNESLTEDKRQFDESLGEDKRQFDSSMSYNQEQAKQEQANWEREMAVKESQAQAKESGEEYEYKTPTEKMFTSGMEAALKGGEAAVMSYCDTIADYDGFAIMDYCQKKLTFTKTKDTINGLWGLDHNDVFVDGYGQTYTLDEIKKSLGLSDSQLKQLTKLKEGVTLDLFTNLKD